MPTSQGTGAFLERDARPTQGPYWAEHTQRPRLFSLPAPPYLVIGDTAAFVLFTLLSPPGRLVAAVGLAVLLTCHQISALYRSRLTVSVLDDFPLILASVVASAVISQWAGTAFDDQQRDVAGWVRRGVLLLVLLLLVRATCYATIHRQRQVGRVRHKTLIVGTGQVGIRLTETLQDHRELGLDVLGFVEAVLPVGPAPLLPAPVLGRPEDLASLIVDERVKVVIVAFGALREAELVEVLRTCDRLRSEIMFVPRLFELHSMTRDMDQVWGIPLVRVRRAPFRRVTWRLKRVFDCLFAAVALVVLAPLWLACAVAVRLDSGPGILFRQSRVGLDGRSFTLLKFRSLRPATEEESALTWNIAHDDRLGPVGRVLRRTSLDELPQLLNVLRGDMSLVGPRPERPHFVDTFSAYVPRYTARHRVPAGLTGWAQVHGLRGDTSIGDRASFDNYYIENWSLWGDTKILLRTLGQVVQRSGS